MDLEREDRPLGPVEGVDHVMEDQSNRSKSHNTSIPHRPTSSWERLLDWGWGWECFCWILVIGAVIAMVSVIAAAQNQPIATWRHHHANISINAVVAVLSALFKGTCMYIVAEGTSYPSICKDELT